MNLRYGLCLAFLCASISPAFADDDGDKLDVILKEIRLLSQRVSRLEEQLQSLVTAKPVQTEPANDPLPESNRKRAIIQMQRLTDVEEVIRLQGESPGSLIKGLHERERVLRQRQFPPEVFPQPVWIIPRH